MAEARVLRDVTPGTAVPGRRPADGALRAGLALLGVLVIAAVLAPWIAPHDPLAPPTLSVRLEPPSTLHPLGTDGLGRDLLSRILYGGRTSIAVGVFAMALALAAGTVLGGVAGYLGGWWDALLARVVDVVLAVPRLVLLIVIVGVLGAPSFAAVVGVLAFTQWPQVARLVRGQVMALKERPFVEGARAAGVTDAGILLRHILPNALGPLLVAATLGVGDTIALEAGLSFLGLGVQPPLPSWGAMVADGRDHLYTAWWISTFAGLAIAATVIAFNLVGAGLERALDPRRSAP